MLLEQDAYALYLAPSSLPERRLWHAAAACNKQWQGLHATLAGFAITPAHVTDSTAAEAPTHATSPAEALLLAHQHAMNAALKAAQQQQHEPQAQQQQQQQQQQAQQRQLCTKWTCRGASWQCTPDGKVIILLPPSDPVLNALAGCMSQLGMFKPRRTHHITLGSLQQLKAAMAAETTPDPDPAPTPTCSASPACIPIAESAKPAASPGVHEPCGSLLHPGPKLPLPGAPSEQLPEPLAYDMERMRWELVIARSESLEPLRVVERRMRLPLNWPSPGGAEWDDLGSQVNAAAGSERGTL